MTPAADAVTTEPSILLSGTWEIEPIQAALHLAGMPDNWDGEGSARPTAAAVNAAVNFISSIAELSFVEELPTPQLYPVPGGGAQIEWRFGERYLEIEIMPDATAHYVTALGGDPQRERPFPVWAPMQAKPLLEWLVSGA